MFSANTVPCISFKPFPVAVAIKAGIKIHAMSFVFFVLMYVNVTRHKNAQNHIAFFGYSDETI